MTETGTTSAERLDSWKAIADYLQRDVRTVRRWEKTLALPVRRVAGSRGHSVFAYVSEVEIWLKTAWPAAAASKGAIEVPADAQVESTTGVPSHLSIEPTESESLAQTPSHARWRWSVAGAAVLLVVTGLAWVGRGSGSDGEALTVRLTPHAVVATEPGGAERWQYAFPPREEAQQPLSTPIWVGRGKGAEVLVPIMSRQSMADEAVTSGQILWLTPEGRLDRTFTLEDTLSFKERWYSSPWALADIRVDERHNTRRVAIAAHHFQWWPGLVTVLDEHGHRQGTFVNAGWIERIHWLSADRLIAGGFSNARDGGMIALLDANALDGQSPVADTSAFRCTSCAAGGPLRYIVFPRSEVNRATGAPFNRVVLQPGDDRLLVRTVEVPAADGAATDAIYEFSPSLDLLRASYSDRYWDAHLALEADGKLTHTREQCPDRDGPTHIDVWEPAAGWKTLTIAQ